MRLQSPSQDSNHPEDLFQSRIDNNADNNSNNSMIARSHKMVCCAGNLFPGFSLLTAGIEVKEDWTRVWLITHNDHVLKRLKLVLIRALY